MNRRDTDGRVQCVVADAEPDGNRTLERSTILQQVIDAGHLARAIFSTLSYDSEMFSCVVQRMCDVWTDTVAKENHC